MTSSKTDPRTATTRLSTKGQVVLPQAIRQRHGWTPGTELEIEDRGDAILLRPRREVPATTLDEIAGCLSYSGPVRSLEDMDRAIEDEARKRR